MANPHDTVRRVALLLWGEAAYINGEAVNLIGGGWNASDRKARSERTSSNPMNLISTVIGILALIAALVALIPLLGWLNWFVIPVVAIGLLFGLFSGKTTGRNINLIVLAIAMFRLFMGGGLL